ncbi:MAG: helix-turn-helix domain-containing protein [Anaerolineales bacterium]|jgi:DNA-binding MarR family transcriptional regulator
MSDRHWTFITNHAAVLTLLAREENLTARKIASELNITTRTVFRIIQDLEEGGYITVSKQGRENRYAVNQSLPLRRENQREIQVRDLLGAITN